MSKVGDNEIFIYDVKTLRTKDRSGTGGQECRKTNFKYIDEVANSLYSITKAED